MVQQGNTGEHRGKDLLSLTHLSKKVIIRIFLMLITVSIWSALHALGTTKEPLSLSTPTKASLGSVSSDNSVDQPNVPRTSIDYVSASTTLAPIPTETSNANSSSVTVNGQTVSAATNSSNPSSSINKTIGTSSGSANVSIQSDVSGTGSSSNSSQTVRVDSIGSSDLNVNVNQKSSGGSMQ